MQVKLFGISNIWVVSPGSKTVKYEIKYSVHEFPIGCCNNIITYILVQSSFLGTRWFNTLF